MDKLAVMGTNYASRINSDELISLLSIEGINEPLHVRCNYGYKSKNKPSEDYIIYPPFKVLDRHVRTKYTLGCTIVECSMVEKIDIK